MQPYDSPDTPAQVSQHRTERETLAATQHEWWGQHPLRVQDPNQRDTRILQEYGRTAPHPYFTYDLATYSPSCKLLLSDPRKWAANVKERFIDVATALAKESGTTPRLRLFIWSAKDDRRVHYGDAAIQGAAAAGFHEVFVAAYVGESPKGFLARWRTLRDYGRGSNIAVHPAVDAHDAHNETHPTQDPRATFFYLLDRDEVDEIGIISRADGALGSKGPTPHQQACRWIEDARRGGVRKPIHMARSPLGKAGEPDGLLLAALAGANSATRAAPQMGGDSMTYDEPEARRRRERLVTLHQPSGGIRRMAQFAPDGPERQAIEGLQPSAASEVRDGSLITKHAVEADLLRTLGPDAYRKDRSALARHP